MSAGPARKPRETRTSGNPHTPPPRVVGEGSPPQQAPRRRHAAAALATFKPDGIEPVVSPSGKPHLSGGAQSWDDVRGTLLKRTSGPAQAMAPNAATGG